MSVTLAVSRELIFKLVKFERFLNIPSIVVTLLVLNELKSSASRAESANI